MTTPAFRAAKIELARHDWASYRAPLSAGPHIPDIFARMLEGGHASTAIGFSLEGRLEVQSMLYEIALPATGVILAALAGGRLEDWVEAEFLTALHTIVYGEPHHTELQRGNHDLAHRCILKAKDGIWPLYETLRRSNADYILDILAALDEDDERLNAFRRRYLKS